MIYNPCSDQNLRKDCKTTKVRILSYWHVFKSFIHSSASLPYYKCLARNITACRIYRYIFALKHIARQTLHVCFQFAVVLLVIIFTPKADFTQTPFATTNSTNIGFQKLRAFLSKTISRCDISDLHMKWSQCVEEDKWHYIYTNFF